MEFETEMEKKYNSNHYPMDAKGQQEQIHYPSQQQFFPPQEGLASLPGIHSIMDAPPPYAPTASLIENQQTAAVTQQALLVSTSSLVLCLSV